MVPYPNIPLVRTTPDSVSHRGRGRRVDVATTLLIFLLATLAGRDAMLARVKPPRRAAVQVDLNALINGLQARYSRMGGLAADFVQIYQGADGRVRRESGRLLLKRPSKARWEYTSPERKLFISDGKNIYFYVEGDKEATRSSIKESTDPQIPFLFLLGRGNLRRDFSRIEVVANEPVVTAGNLVLLLAPKRAPEDFRKLMAEVSPASFQVRRLVIFERSGARMEFLLSGVRENYAVADSEFNFTPPPGVRLRQAQ